MPAPQDVQVTWPNPTPPKLGQPPASLDWAKQMLQVLSRFQAKLIAADPYNTGDLRPTVDGAAPTGWLLCNGAVLVKADYPELFKRIGVTFNTGGETGAQFRLPNGTPFTNGKYIIKL